MPNQRGGGHLSARHAVNGVVDENRGELLAAVRRVDHLRRADGRHIAVPLVANNQMIGQYPLDAGSGGGGSAVGGLHRVKVKVEVSPNGAAHRVGDDRLFPQPQLVNDTGDNPVDNAVAAAPAVLGGDFI